MDQERQQLVPADHEPLAKQTDGPFFCAHCTFYELATSGCSEPHIVARYGPRKQRDGKVTVHPFQCSDYYQSTGEALTLPVVVRWLRQYAKHIMVRGNEELKR